MKNTRWIYAIVGFIVMLCAGLVYAWTNISKPIKEEMIEVQKEAFTNSDFSMVFTICIIFFCLGGILGGFIVKKFNARISILAAMILFPVGMFITSKASMSSFISLYLGYGILVGLSAGFVYNAVLSSVTKWFQDKQGLISGLLLMGFGIGGFALGPVFNKLNAGMEWRKTFLVMGIAIAVILLLSIFFFKTPSEADLASLPVKKEKKTLEEGISVGTGGMLKRKSFWIYFAWSTLLTASGLSMIPNALGFVQNIDSTTALQFLMLVAGMISVFSGLGRIIFGYLFDKQGRKFSMVSGTIVFIIASLVLIVALKTSNLSLTMLGFALAGISYGGIPSINSAYVNTFYGNQNYALNLPVMNTNLIAASLLGSYISGWLLDSSYSYMGIVVLMLGFAIIALISPFLIRKA